MDQEKQDQKKTVVGPDNQPIPANQLTLAIEKFKSYEGKYRLIWVQGQRAWYCAEDPTLYRRKYGPGGVVEAGQALAERVGAHYFSEITR